MTTMKLEPGSCGLIVADILETDTQCSLRTGGVKQQSRAGPIETISCFNSLYQVRGWICLCDHFTHIVSNGVQIVSDFHNLTYIQLRQRVIIWSYWVWLDGANVIKPIVSPFWGFYMNGSGNMGWYYYHHTKISAEEVTEIRLGWFQISNDVEWVNNMTME